MSSPKRAIPFEPAQLRPRHDGWTAFKQIRFIEALAATGCVAVACRIVGKSETSANNLKNHRLARGFRRAWDAALDCAMPRLEAAILGRAIEGVPRPIFYKGEQVGEWRQFDERLGMFLLRSRRAHRYGPPQEVAPDPEDEPTPTITDCAIVLDGHLDEIDLGPSIEDGNAHGEDEWSDDWADEDKPGPAAE